MKRQDIARGFPDVDRAGDPAALVAHVERVRTLPEVQTLKRENLARLELRAGDAALDAGYGTGADLLALARLVAPGGLAVGVERSATMQAEARRRAAGGDLPVAFVLGDAGALPLRDDAFDAVYAERLLLHVADPAVALAELTRVLRPGGRLVVSDVDLGGYLFDLPDRQLTRAVMRYREDHAFRHGWIGRQLPRLCHAAGLADIRVFPTSFPTFGRPAEAFVAQLRLTAARATADGALTAAERDRWDALLTDAIANGNWFHTIAQISVAARKP